MKKMILTALATMMALSLLCACSNVGNDKIDVSPEPTETADDSNNPTVKPAKDEDGFVIAVEGFYDGEEKVSVVEGTTYLNLFGTRTYYVTPNEKTRLMFPGNANDWEVQADKYKIVETFDNSNGKVYLTTIPVTYSGNQPQKSTGYIYFQNKATEEIVKVYVQLPMPQNEETKQTDEKLPYFLYFEKGAYKKFESGSCVLTVFRADADGYYTVPYITLSSACGALETKTPTGVHTLDVENRERWHSWGDGSDKSAFGQYVTPYENEVFIHGSATNSGRNELNMMAENYNAIGTHCSGGCLRMQAGSAYWIWCNCPNGTKLKIVSNNPLGTRTEVPKHIRRTGKITYDPTDPFLLVGKTING